MDRHNDELRVIVDTSAGHYPGGWGEYTATPGAAMTNGRLGAVEVDGAASLLFVTRDGMPMFIGDEANLIGAAVVKRALNTIVEVACTQAGKERTVCFVGPRGRMRKIFAAVGHPLG